MIPFKGGDRVRWVRALTDTDHAASEGIVLAVVPNDHGIVPFTEYDIKFSFGEFRLYGTQIESGTPTPNEISPAGSS